MELNEKLLLAVVTIIFIWFLLPFFYNSRFPNVPGPSFFDYVVPGRLANSLFMDTKTANRTMVKLCKKYGTVFQFRFGPFIRSVVTTDPTDMRQIITNATDFVLAPAIVYTMDGATPGNIFVLRGEPHRNLRKHLHSTLNSSSLDYYHLIIQDAILEMVNLLSMVVDGKDFGKSDKGREEFILDAKKRKIDIAGALSVVTLKVMTTAAFGAALPLPGRRKFAEDVGALSREMLMEMVWYPLSYWLKHLGWRRNFNAITSRLRKSGKEYIRKRRQETEDERKARGCQRDLMDALLEFYNDDTTIVNHTVTFGLAGSFTTNESMAWAIYELCGSPEARKKLHAEIDKLCGDLSLDEYVSYEDFKKAEYVHKVWKETLRLHPPAPRYVRTASRDMVLRGTGTFIPKGTYVQGITWSTQLDEQYYPEPKWFNPDRWGSPSPQPDMTNATGAPLGTYVPFGFGPHRCAGQFLVEYEGPLVIMELYRRFDFRLACDRDDIVSCSGFVEVARYSSKGDGALDGGTPVVISRRTRTGSG